MSDRRPHALYRFWDDGDALLYVGISLNPGERWKQHRADKPWWFEVTKVTVENFPDRVAVLEAERQAIIAEGPKYNIVHNAPTSTRNRSILRLDGVRVVITCQRCLRAVIGADGYVWIDNAELNERERAWAAFDERQRRGSMAEKLLTRDQLGPRRRPDAPIEIDLTDLMSLPGSAEWQAHHLRCDPDPERSSYFLHGDRIDTVGKLLDWTAHLMGKSWIGHTNWDDVIRAAGGVDA